MREKTIQLNAIHKSTILWVIGEKWDKKNMLYTIISVLFILWLIGFIMHIGGGFIHLLLVIALIVFIVNMVNGRRTV